MLRQRDRAIVDLSEPMTFFEDIPLPYFYPYPRSFSFRGSHLLPGQDLDVISIPFQIYFIQVTTTRFLESVKLQKSSFWCRNQGNITW